MITQEQKSIVEQLLTEGVYTKTPKVALFEDGQILGIDGFERHLSLWYDRENHYRAILQNKAMSLFIEYKNPYRFSNNSTKLVKYFRTETPYELLERYRDTFDREDIPVEMVHTILDTVEDNEWVVQCRYNININPGIFEKLTLPFVQTRVELTPQTFQRYYSYLQNVRKGIITYWEGLVSKEEMLDFADKHLEIWKRWVDFFCDDGRDIYVNKDGKLAPKDLVEKLGDNELSDQGYNCFVPVEKTYKVAEGLHESSLLIREIERLHNGESLEFLLGSEVTVRE